MASDNRKFSAIGEASICAAAAHDGRGKATAVSSAPQDGGSEEFQRQRPLHG